MIRGIVPPFYEGKPVCPLVYLFKRKVSQIGLEELADHFSLTLYLG
jgi:hypothetical protein